jgi:hypothetical protein
MSLCESEVHCLREEIQILNKILSEIQTHQNSFHSLEFEIISSLILVVLFRILCLKFYTIWSVQSEEQRGDQHLRIGEQAEEELLVDEELG